MFNSEYARLRQNGHLGLLSHLLLCQWSLWNFRLFSRQVIGHCLHSAFSFSGSSLPNTQHLPQFQRGWSEWAELHTPCHEYEDLGKLYHPAYLLVNNSKHRRVFRHTCLDRAPDRCGAFIILQDSAWDWALVLNLEAQCHVSLGLLLSLPFSAPLCT